MFHIKGKLVNRTPPRAVKEELRKESGYQCSIPECGSPYLEWHHFDPPWEIQEHHNPEGMLALCSTCHPLADGGAWTKDQLKNIKEANRRKVLNLPIEGKFKFFRNDFLLDTGGNYYFRNRIAEVSLHGSPLIWFEKNELGLKQLNVRLFNRAGIVYFQIENNCWGVRNHIKDIVCPPSGRLLSVIFQNENFVKIEFVELNDSKLLKKNLSKSCIEFLEDEKISPPITLLKIGLRLQEFGVDISPRKLSYLGLNVSGSMFIDSNMGICIS